MLRFPLLALALLPATASSESCTETMTRVDANQDGRLDLSEFSAFVQAEADKSTSSHVNVAAPDVPTDVVQDLFARFATTNGGDEGISISTSQASQRAVLELLCERTSRAVGTAARSASSSTTTDAAKEKGQGPFQGEVIANKQDFDFDALSFTAWGIDWNVQSVQEKCPEQFQTLVGCVMSDCPQFMDVCPTAMSEIKANNQGGGNANATAPDTADFPYTCTDIESGLCSVLDQDCCLYDCKDFVQEAIDCVVLELTAVDLGCSASAKISCPAIEAANAEPVPAPMGDDGMGDEYGSMEGGGGMGDYGGGGDDDFFGDIFELCTEEMTAMEVCADANSCFDCMSELEMGNNGDSMPTPEMFMDMGGGAGGEDGMMMPEFDVDAIMAEMNNFLAQQCDAEQQNVCKMASCCPKCEKEMIATYGCFSTALSAGLGEMLGGLFGGLEGLLANVTDALGAAAEALEGLGDLEGLLANLTESLGDLDDLDLEGLLANLTDTLGDIPGLEGMLGNLTDIFGGDVNPEDLGDLLGGLLGNVTDLMGKQGGPPGGPPPGTPAAGMPAGPDFSCDWSELKCDGGAGGGGGGGSDAKNVVLVNTAFILSSLGADITVDQLKEQLESGGAETLKAAFRAFVKSVTKTMGGGRRRLGLDTLFATRKLAGKFLAESAEIYDVREADCATAIQSGDAVAISKQGGGENKTCFAIFGQYGVQLAPADNAKEVYEKYVNATQAAISGGKLEAAMKEVDPTGASPFAVEGASTIVDEFFDPFVLAQADSSSSSTPPPVTPTVDNPAATESSNSTAGNERDTPTSNATDSNATGSNTTETKSAAPALAGGYMVAVFAMLLMIW